MPGNLRKKADGKRGRSERDYLAARRRVLRASQICTLCGKAIDMQLKPVCQFVDTGGFSAETAHLIPLDCGDGCREAKHHRKPSPWSKSADHKIPVAELLPDSPLLTSVSNLAACHLICNQRKGKGVGGGVVARHKTSRDWFT